MIRIDMDMPENCAECRFEVSDYGYCSAMPEEFCGYTKDKGRACWCPLHPIETFGDGVCTKSPSGEEERFTLYRDSLTERKEEQP